jgi:hypothetical protein
MGVGGNAMPWPFYPWKETWHPLYWGLGGLGAGLDHSGKSEPQTDQPIVSHAVGMLRIISEWTLDVDEELCACFIDWQKAFDVN